MKRFPLEKNGLFPIFHSLPIHLATLARHRNIHKGLFHYPQHLTLHSIHIHIQYKVQCGHMDMIGKFLLNVHHTSHAS